jgi:hypothetical protein
MPIGSGTSANHPGIDPRQDSGTSVRTSNPKYLKNANAPRLNANAPTKTARRRPPVTPDDINHWAACALIAVDRISRKTNHGVCHP